MPAPPSIQPLLSGTWSLYSCLAYCEGIISLYGNAGMPNFVELEFLGPDILTATAAQGKLKADADPDTTATLWGVVNALQLAVSNYGMTVPMPTFKGITFRFDDGLTWTYTWENTT